MKWSVSVSLSLSNTHAELNTEPHNKCSIIDIFSPGKDLLLMELEGGLTVKGLHEVDLKEQSLFLQLKKRYAR